MLKKSFLMFFISISSFINAGDEHHGSAEVAKEYLKEVTKDNELYMQKLDPKLFEKLAKGQTPRVTVVSCADSRVHTTAIDNTPEGDVFMIRNIGNQLSTAHGSVEYGINHLGSSMLLFIGHSSCGAIKAASGDYSTLEDPIKKELDTIKVEKGGVVIDNVKKNVNNQVTEAMKEWSAKVKNGELLIVGAIYDFSNDMKNGSGKLNIININGETDNNKFKELLTTKSEVKKQEDK